MIQNILIEEPRSFALLRGSETQLLILVLFLSNMLMQLFLYQL